MRQLVFTIPFFIILLSELVASLPLPHNFAVFVSLLPLATVYYWSVYTPNLLSLLPTAVLGLLFDLITAGFLGLYVLLFFIVQAVAERQRRLLAEGSFMSLWVGFAVAAAVAVAVGYLVSGLKGGIFAPPTAVAYQFFAVVAVFPLLASSLEPVARRLSELEGKR